MHATKASDMSTQDKPFSLYDVKYRLIGIPLVSLLMAVINYYSETAPVAPPFLQTLQICFIFTLCLWEGNIVIFKWSRKLFPDFKQTRTRLIFQTLFEASFVLLFIHFSSIFLPAMGLQCSHKNSTIQGLTATLIVSLIYESVYFFGLWKEHIIKTESLLYENAKSQLDALKSQLDPHFLFNSMNTLASLVGEENKEAQTFLAQLSDVYRYVLVSREKNSVTLMEEMDFLDSYIYLNKIRFRENFQVEKNISPETYQKSIAPLSLQLLMENAIKHNSATRDRPLKISISDSEAGYIVMKNNIQEKKILEKSLKLGLLNIINRYKLLTEKQVSIASDKGHFTVKLPLLSK